MESVRDVLLPRRAVALVFVTVILGGASLAQSSSTPSLFTQNSLVQSQGWGVPQGKDSAGTWPSSSSSAVPAEPEPQSSAPQDKPEPQSPAPETTPKDKQSPRIGGVIPNYRAVNSDAKLPPLTFKGKFKLASHQTFDYSSVLVAGAVAGIRQAENAMPEFHQGAAGYGRYFWHTFADEGVANYATLFVVPFVTREDPRYYVRGRGGFIKRAGYAVSRLLVTRTDAGGQTFNFSEIAGNGVATSLSCLYYPQQERTWTKIGQRWAAQVALDGVFNVFNEFWPDIRHKVFRK